MKKLALSISILIIVLAGLTACNAGKAATPPEDLDSALFGTWIEDYFQSGYIFNEDGTGEDTFWDLPFTYTAKDGLISVKYDDEMWGIANYSYVLEEDTLSLQQSGSAEIYEYKRTE